MRQTLAFAFLPSQVGAALLGSLGLHRHHARDRGLVRDGVLHGDAPHARNRHPHGARRDARNRWRAWSRGDAAILVAVGVVVGLGIAALITQPLSMFLVAGLSASDPVSFAGTALLFAAGECRRDLGPRPPRHARPAGRRAARRLAEPPDALPGVLDSLLLTSHRSGCL